MTCDVYRDSLPELLDGGYLPDGGLDADRRAALEAHAATCADCRALTADLQRIARVASSLERHAPPRDGWSTIARRLQQEPGFGTAASHPAPASRRNPSQWSWLAAAAMLIVAIGATLVFLKRGLDGPSSRTTTGGNAPQQQLVESVESEVQQAAAHFENVVALLEQMANQNDSPLDPEVTAKLRQSLGVIDQAIDESRRALRSEPESQLAQASLLDAFRRKVSLLQDTIALMNEMRKGNQAEAARIDASANKS